MKKIHNYLMKPEVLRKKLQNPSFRNDFIEWSKSNLHVNRQSNSFHNRSKSPIQQHYKTINTQIKRPQSSQSKENIKYSNNIRPNTSIKPKVAPKIDQTIKCHVIHNQRKSINKNIYERDSCKNLNQKNSKSTIDLSDKVKKIRSSSAMSNYSKPKIKSTQTSVNQVLESQLNIKFTYSYRTRQGVLATNPNKTNQDSLLIKNKILNKNISLFAVADGHGSFGHLVSQLIAKNIVRQTEKYLSILKASEAFPKVFDSLQETLTNSDINIGCSGSTLVSVLIQGNKLTCANVGDSRAILARQIDRKSWQMIYLSQDHKPSNEFEKKRIIKNGGRVHAFKDEKGNSVGPLRVWLPNQNIQGLAMSRSMGDNVSKPVGVIHNPEIIQVSIDKRDKFLLLASDGVWQFISNQEVLQLIVPFYRQNKLQEGCDALMKLAYERWTVEDQSVIDDITFILIFFNQ